MRAKAFTFVAICLCLGKLPDRARVSVGHLNSAFVQLSADVVGTGPVPVRACRAAVRHQLLDFPDLGSAQIGDGASPVDVGQLKSSQLEAEQGVGGGDDHALALRRET